LTTDDTVTRLNREFTGRYLVEREIGAGGMATVFLARDLRHERRVAVKVFRPELSAALGPHRFLQEIRITASLQHPHILAVHDSGDADGLLYYIMPFVAGENLREKLAREGELPIADAIRILRDVADAMVAAHAKSVVHRDIKPENVLLSNRHAIVADFGVAKALSAASSGHAMTTAGVALGTPTYMAPEQASADAHTDHRADIYAFGVLAYELLVGRPPFAGASAQKIVAAHMTEAPLPLGTRRANVPPLLAQLVMRCLEKSPADRPQAAGELLAVLEVLGTSSGAVLPVGGTNDGKPARMETHRFPRVAVLIGVVIIAALGGASLWARRPGITLEPNPTGKQPLLTAKYDGVPLRDVLRELSGPVQKTFIASPAAETVKVTARFEKQAWDVALLKMLNSRSLVGEEDSTGVIVIATTKELRQQNPNFDVGQTYVRLRWVRAEKIVGTVRAMTSKRATISVDSLRNALLILAPASEIAGVREAIAALDATAKPRP
jgi:tRNA A-37 threonylcarbamoyl transferase component Bud32